MIEKIQVKRKRKSKIKEELEVYNINYKKPNEEVELEILDSKENELVEAKPQEEEVVYVEEDNVEEKAKEKLEEVTKKLIEEDNSLIEHTNFEKEQEEKSIISYEELIQASHNIDEKNDMLLLDEGEEPITIEELYQKHADNQNKLEEEETAKVNNPIFEEKEERKFKNSEVISPVFGLYTNEQKDKNKIYQTPKETFDEIDKTVDMKDLELEIEKTEEFLSELRRLKNKLD